MRPHRVHYPQVVFVILHLHGVIDKSCIQATHDRLQSRNAGLKMASDAIAVANFDEVLPCNPNPNPIQPPSN